MIRIKATLPCSDPARPRMPVGASLERGIAYVSAGLRGTGLPSSAPLDARRGTGDAPTFATKQAPAVGSRAWSPPV